MSMSEAVGILTSTASLLDLTMSLILASLNVLGLISESHLT